MAVPGAPSPGFGRVTGERRGRPGSYPVIAGRPASPRARGPGARSASCAGCRRRRGTRPAGRRRRRRPGRAPSIAAGSHPGRCGHDADAAAQADQGQDGLVAGHLAVDLRRDPAAAEPAVGALARLAGSGQDDRQARPVERLAVAQAFDLAGGAGGRALAGEAGRGAPAGGHDRRAVRGAARGWAERGCATVLRRRGARVLAASAGGGATIQAGVRIFVCTEPFDMPYGFDRLAQVARERFGQGV